MNVEIFTAGGELLLVTHQLNKARAQGRLFIAIRRYAC
jgi:hypothetical protein